MKQLIDLAAAAARLSPERRRLVEKLLAEKGIDPSRLPIQRRSDLAAPVPVSFAQQRLWFLEQLAPGQTAFHLQAVVLLDGPLALPALAHSFQRLADRHEALRTVFETSEGEPVQRVLPRVEITLRQVDLERLAETGTESVHRLARLEVSQPFDLERGPLLRALVVRLGAERHAVVVTLHHIVGDGWSMGLLIYEMTHLYEAASRGLAAQLPGLDVQYPDFAAWQRQWLGGALLERQISQRVGQLEDVPPVLDLPAPKGRPEVPSARGRARELEVDLGVVELARRSSKGTTPFMVMAAVLATLLSRLAGQRLLALGFPNAGRSRTEVQSLIGFFINTLVLRCDLRGNPTFSELVERIRQDAVEAYASQDVPFERLVEALGGERDLSRSPIFQVLLNLLDLEAGRPKPANLGELQLQGLESQQSEAKFDLALHVLGVADSGVQINMIYALDLFDEVWIEHFVRRFQRLARELTAHPDRPIDQAEDRSHAERHQLLVEWNDTRRHRVTRDLVAAIRAQAEARPEAIALAYRARTEGVEATWTYRQTMEHATALAHRLRTLGVGPERVVALLAERSLEAHGALLGVLACGAAYLALDPRLPDARLRAMVEVAEPRWILASAAQRSRTESLGIAPEPVILDLEAVLDGTSSTACALTPLPPRPHSGEGEPEGDLVPAGTKQHSPGHRPGAGGPARRSSTGKPWRPLPAVDPANLAYVVFTSGSSGRPKGIATARGDVENHLDYVLEEIGLGSDDRVLQITSLGFDGSVRGSFGALLAGARLEILEDSEAMDPRVLVDRLVGDRVTAILAVVPTLLSAILDEAEARQIRLPDLRKIFVAGESFSLALWRRARLILAPGARIVHQYGPTEAALTSTVEVVPLEGEAPRAAVGGALLAGRPIRNQTIHLLDDRLRPRPQGAVGEIHIGGEGLARGYVGRPGQTAVSFVPDPHGSAPGARLYRTGDLGRLERDGRLRILGRRDGQVKLRGQRLELGELEALLGEHPAVGRVALRLWRGDELASAQGATAEGSIPKGDTLVAYVERAASAAPEASVDDLEAALRDHLRRHLPESLQPNQILWLDRLPRTRSGKIDRRHLPPPEATTSTGSEGLHGTTEELLAGIWRDLLGLDGVGREGHFFDLGGHSLLATRVVSRIAAVCGVDVPLRTLFENPVLRDLAARVDQLRDEAGGRRTPPLVAGPRPDHVPLALAQERLWLLDRLDPNSHAFNLRIALRARGPLDPTALATALSGLLQRHESLRTRFDEVAGDPVQVIDPGPGDGGRGVRLPRVDLRTLSEAQSDRQLRRVVVAESRRPFDLRRGPVFRARLVALGPEDHAILMTLHHIVGDAWSLGVLAGEMAELYHAAVEGRRPRLKPMAIQYPDFALWQRRWLSGEVLDGQIEYWRRQLGSAPSTELPTDFQRPATQTFRGSRLDFAIPEDLGEALRQLSQEEGATLFMTLLAGLDVLLARSLQQDDVVVGTHIANRNRAETEGLIGFFINNLVLRTDLSGDPTGREVVRRTRRTCLDAYAHQDLPFARLVQELRPERDPSRTPFFQIMLVLQNVPTENVGERLRASELELRPLSTASPIAKFDLTLFVFEQGSSLHGFFEYNTDLFREDTIQRFAERLETVWRGLVDDPEQPISQLSLGADATVRALENAFTDDLY